jgi:hypothetical protein
MAFTMPRGTADSKSKVGYSVHGGSSRSPPTVDGQCFNHCDWFANVSNCKVTIVYKAIGRARP